MTKTSSWVVRERETGRVLCETFNAATAARVNTLSPMYEAVPIGEYLGALNANVAKVAK